MLRVLGFGLVLLAAGCSGGGGSDPTSQMPAVTAVCEAGRTEACPCVDGAMGAQTCDADGGGWAACKCASDRAAPKQYKPDSVCTLDTSEAAMTEGLVKSTCGSWPVRIFTGCMVPDDGVLIGCKSTVNAGQFCCF